MNLSTIFEYLSSGNRAQAIAVVDANGVQLPGFDQSRPANATLTSVAGLATSAVLVVANPARRQVMIYNDSGKNLRIAFAATATATAFTRLIPSKQEWVGDLNGYMGDIAGIWEGAGGFARITEVTT